MQRIKHLLLFVWACLLPATVVEAATAQVQNHNKSLTQYVNTRIGTGGHGHVFFGANVPFGLVQVGPSQNTRGWDWCSGYYETDSVLIGFGSMHLSGTGIGSLGDVALLPVCCPKRKDVIFSHDAEMCYPGYYSVKLAKPNVLVELTATQRVAMHRYTFGHQKEKAMLKLDLAQSIGWNSMVDCDLKQESPTRLTGWRSSTGWSNDRTLYFCIDFSEPISLQDAEGKEGKAVKILTFDNHRVIKPLLVKIALSPTGIAGAKANMLAELPGWDFAETVKRADEAWNRELSRVTIDTDNETRKTIFYTALYHLMTAPSVYCDANGDYCGSDHKVYKADFTNYTTLSLWDTYRAAHPFFTLAFPDKQRDFAETFIHIAEQSDGQLPVWHLMGCDTYCMVGNPGAVVLADLALKGYVADMPHALDLMNQTGMKDRQSLHLLKKYGYIPWDLEPEHETVAKALEFCLADDGIARVAKAVGNKKLYNYYNKRGQSYSKYFDKKLQFMRAVDSKGAFRTPFDPFDASHRTNDYVEGNAWHYTWLVPHDPHGLIKLFGSDKAFINKLDSLFIIDSNLGEGASPDISGLIGQYAHGNEPSHHVLYLYTYAGQPWKTAKWVRRIYDEMYRNDPDGLCGNEDVGQMSAWYLTSTIGLYQVEPAGGKYVIGSPLFNSATIRVGDGKTFTVRAKDNSDENIYIQSASLNGKPYTKAYINYADIMAGGVLELQMGDKPSQWGTDIKDRP